MTVNSGCAVGGLFALPPAAYGQFQLGSPPGAALSVSGSLTGGNGGATSTATIVTTQDAVGIAQLCASGVKALNIGLGTITLQ